jgi:hypothetical protein
LRFFGNFGAQIFREMKQIRLNQELTHLISKNMGTIRRAFIVICSVVYLSLNIDLMYAQTNTQGGTQGQVLSQLEQKMTSFLSTVQTKQEEVQTQIKQLELDLQNHQAKKKKRKDQAADELKEQSLKKQIAILSDKSKQYQKLEDDAIAFLSTVKDKQESAQAPGSKPSTSSLAQSQKSSQGQTAPLSEREKQIQAVQKNIAELTAQIEAKKQTSQTAQSTVSPERERRLQELEQKTLALNEQMKTYAQSQQQKSAGVSGQTTQLTATEREQKIQEVMQRIADVTEQISQQKQANQLAYSPERERRIQELEKNATTLNEQLKVEMQAQQKPATVSAEKPIAQLTAAEREQKIQEVMQKIADVTEQINQRKLAATGVTEQTQPTQLAASSDKNKSSQEVKKNVTVPTSQPQGGQKEVIASNQQTQTPVQRKPGNVNEQRPTTQPIASPEKDRQIKELEKTVADLNAQVRTYSQNQQRQTSTYEQKQRELTATISEKDKRIQELERNISLLNANKGYTSVASSSRTQPVASQRSSTTTSTTRNQPLIYQGNVNSGYYIIFGSFVERNNAERFLTKLRKQYPNVVDLGNNNMFGMYRTGIGPYKTKEEALAHRPTDAKNWVFRVETIPNTLVAYFEIIEE